jgi:hypothetical protein
VLTRTPSLPPLPGAVLARLRLSLNTPVVSVAGLPVGPASAAIALERAAGTLRLTLALRSTRNGQVVYFQPGSRPAPGAPEALALEAVLAFAEGMGFLFDDDAVASGEGEALAARRWARFAPEQASAAPGGARSEAQREAQQGQLLLSKFRFLAAIPAERLLAPPPADGPDGMLRLLSHF